jgi:hypothetical protein
MGWRLSLGSDIQEGDLVCLKMEGSEWQRGLVVGIYDSYADNRRLYILWNATGRISGGFIPSYFRVVAKGR